MADDRDAFSEAYQYRSAASSTLANTADNRALLEAGADVSGLFIAPQADVALPGSTKPSITGTNNALSITGLTGGDVNALLGQLFDFETDQRAGYVDVTQAALASIGQTAEASQSAVNALVAATQTPDYAQWLPYLVIGAVALLWVTR